MKNHMALPNLNGNRKAAHMETILLTYEELAARLGVQPESARKTTQRRNWRRVKGNDRHTRVVVPLDELPEVVEIPAPIVPGPTPDEILATLKADKARLEAEATLLRQMLARADASIEDHKAQIERWQADATRWHEQAAQWQQEAGSWRMQATMRAEHKRSPFVFFSFRRRSNGSSD